MIMGDGTSKPEVANQAQGSSSGIGSWLWTGGRPSDTVIIFDWDDTLLCSSAVNVQQCDPGQLQQLEVAVETVLTTAMNLGDTMIVTNGQDKWVQDSSRCFLPKVMPLLNRLKKVMSARSAYEQNWPGDPYAWKKAAFADILSRRKGKMSFSGVNLIVLGDNLAEIEAAQMAMSLRGSSVVKTVKFKDMPSVNELLGQLRVVTQMLPNLVNEDESQSKALVPRSLPPHLAYLTSWASGWRVDDYTPGAKLDTSSQVPLMQPQYASPQYASPQYASQAYAYGAGYSQAGYGASYAQPAGYA